MISRMDFDAETMFEEIKPMYEGADPAHDFSHIMRVFKNAQYVGKAEGADMQILLLAALLHDIGSESKLSKKSSESDALRQKIEDFLMKKGLDDNATKSVLYAIRVHRFSKGLVPSTLEAKILQDADRLDAIGAIGIARVFMTGGAMGRKLYNPNDPFCESREPDDKMWNLDHFFRKLLRLESGMHTETGKRIAKRRDAVLKRYLSDLQRELGEAIEEDIGEDFEELFWGRDWKNRE
jgi:uncharacterized protein